MNADRLHQFGDLHARVTRLVEALDVGDMEFLRIALDDLQADLWRQVEAEDGQA